MCLFPLCVLAASVRLTPPAGWVTSAHADQSALVRANSWSERSGLRLLHVLATSDRDDFVETAALLTHDAPLARVELEQASAARDRLSSVVHEMIVSDVAPRTSGFAPVGLHPQPVFVAAYDVGETTYHAASMPAGSQHVVLLVAYKTGERALYELQFDALLGGVEGVSTPVVPFARKLWRWGTVLGWVLLAALTFLVAMLSADRRGDYRTAGDRAALGMVVLIAAVMSVAWWALDRDESALVASGTSATSVAIEIAIVGAIVAGLMWTLTRLLGREIRIESAPRDGAFSGRSTALHQASDGDHRGLVAGSVSVSAPLPPGPTSRKRATLHWDGIPDSRPAGGASLGPDHDAATPEAATPEVVRPRPPRPPPPPRR